MRCRGIRWPSTRELLRRGRRCTRERRSTTHLRESAAIGPRRECRLPALSSTARTKIRRCSGVRGHRDKRACPWRQAGACQHPKPEMRRAAAVSGDPVGAVAADHGEQVSAVGVRAADHPAVDARVEESGLLRVSLDGDLCAQGGGLGQDAETFQQFALAGRILDHRLGEVGQHLLDEPPGFQARRCPVVAFGVYVRHSLGMDVVSQANAGESVTVRKQRATKARIASAAARAVVDPGLAGTTVEQIAVAAEVGRATFFRYFSAKEDAAPRE